MPVPRARRVAVAIAILASVASSGVAQSPRDFAGRWESNSDDGTQQEVLEFEIAGNDVRGMLSVLETGYFSRRTTVKQQLPMEGTLTGRTLALRIGDGNGNTLAGSAARRGEYLVLRINDREYGFARPGRPLVASAEGSADAARFARQITGRVYSASIQASGRDAAMVGTRMRLALCANGEVAFDASDVGSVPNGDMGSTRSRRGTWGVVLRAGAPVVRAEWQGTGTSYSLVEYFDVVPSSDGRAATVDGTRLPVTGQC